MGESENKKKQAEKRLKICEDKIAEINATIASLEDKLQNFREQLQEAISAAEEGCERMKTTRNQRDINSLIHQLEKCISQDQPSLEDQEKVKKKYADAVENYQNQLTQQKKLRKTMRVSELDEYDLDYTLFMIYLYVNRGPFA